MDTKTANIIEGLDKDIKETREKLRSLEQTKATFCCPVKVGDILMMDGEGNVTDVKTAETKMQVVRDREVLGRPLIVSSVCYIRAQPYYVVLVRKETVEGRWSKNNYMLHDLSDIRHKVKQEEEEEEC